MKSLKVFKKVLKRIIIIVANIVTLSISLLIPKTDKIIIVGGWFGHRFADNSKYFFLYLNEYKRDLDVKKVIWISKQESIVKELRQNGFIAYKMRSIPSIWYHLRSKVHVIDQSYQDINSFFSIRCTRLNLWHGFPLKNIGLFKYDKINHELARTNNIYKFFRDFSIPGYWGKHYLLATSEFSAKILGKAFDLPSDKVIISGYPRNYEQTSDRSIKFVCNNEKKYFDRIKKCKDQGIKIIGYFPTFRDNRETLVFGTNNSNELKELFDYFSKLNILVVGKFHFASKNNNLKKLYKHESFINLPPDADLYTFLNQIDVLITDYSSIYFDYLLWKKPIIFFPYDLEYYSYEDRGLIFDYDEYTPGPKVFSIKELKKLLAEGINNLEYQDKSKKLAEKIYGNFMKMNIEHLIEQIKHTNM